MPRVLAGTQKDTGRAATYGRGAGRRVLARNSAMARPFQTGGGTARPITSILPPSRLRLDSPKRTPTQG